MNRPRIEKRDRRSIRTSRPVGVVVILQIRQLEGRLKARSFREHSVVERTNTHLGLLKKLLDFLLCEQKGISIASVFCIQRKNLEMGWGCVDTKYGTLTRMLFKADSQPDLASFNIPTTKLLSTWGLLFKQSMQNKWITRRNLSPLRDERTYSRRNRTRRTDSCDLEHGLKVPRIHQWGQLQAVDRLCEELQWFGMEHSQISLTNSLVDRSFGKGNYRVTDGCCPCFGVSTRHDKIPRNLKCSDGTSRALGPVSVHLHPSKTDKCWGWQVVWSEPTFKSMWRIGYAL
jgi:hypothetical protein